MLDHSLSHTPSHLPQLPSICLSSFHAVSDRCWCVCHVPKRHLTDGTGAHGCTCHYRGQKTQRTGINDVFHKKKQDFDEAEHAVARRNNNMQEYLARYLALQMEKNKGKANNYTQDMESVRTHTDKLRWSRLGKVKNVGKDNMVARWW